MDILNNMIHLKFTLNDEFMLKKYEEFIDDVFNIIKIDSIKMIFIMIDSFQINLSDESIQNLKIFFQKIKKFDNIKPIVIILPHEHNIDKEHELYVKIITNICSTNVCYFSSDDSIQFVKPQDLYYTICIREAVKRGIIKKYI